MLQDTRNSLVRSHEGVLTAVVGLDDAIVVATGGCRAGDDAPSQKAESVKALVEHLKSHNRRAAVEHRRTIDRGDTTRTWTGSRYRVKRIVVKPGARFHCKSTSIAPSTGWSFKPPRKSRSMRMFARFTRTNSMYIPIGSVHRLANPAKFRWN